jgi:hypothetical protein
MGIYYSVHVGPALVCKFHYTVTFTKEKKVTSYRICNNETCKNKNAIKDKQNKPKFCSACGNLLAVVSQEQEVEKKRTEKSVEDVYDLFDVRPDLKLGHKLGLCMCGLDGDDEFIPDCEILLPDAATMAKLLGRKINFDGGEFALHIRGTPDVAGEIAKVETHFAKEIEFLRTNYDAVKVEWLVLTTGS